MNYRIQLYETFDSNGVSVINLFVEVDNQIYNSVHRFVFNRNKAIAKCFKDIGKMIKEAK